MECVSCRKPFHKHLGGDIGMSSVIGGALVFATYEDRVPGSKIRTLERFGLSSENQRGDPPAKQVGRQDRRKLAQSAARPFRKA